MSQINLNAISEAPLSREPYSYFLASDFLRKDAIDGLASNFPDINKPGYLTVDEVQMKGQFKSLIEELEGPELTETLSKKFGIDLHPFPRLTTIMKRSQPKYGAIHTDGASKVMTMLVYMNPGWDENGSGRLRVLYDGAHFEPYAMEVPPVMGTAFAFLRADNSWHGHLPFDGERRVVQIAWVKSQEELDRKRKRNRVAQMFKGIFGR
jgi:SM-20-related protein